jgi:hypothetical protein
MPTYIAMFAYSNASWARMLNSPSARTAVVQWCSAP